MASCYPLVEENDDAGACDVTAVAVTLSRLQYLEILSSASVVLAPARVREQSVQRFSYSKAVV